MSFIIRNHISSEREQKYNFYISNQISGFGHWIWNEFKDHNRIVAENVRSRFECPSGQSENQAIESEPHFSSIYQMPKMITTHEVYLVYNVCKLDTNVSIKSES